MTDFFLNLGAQYQSYDTYLIVLEAIATFFGIASVYYTIKKNIGVYPTGIISTVLFTYVMFVFGLLGDMLINVYYTVMSIYGWILWHRNANDNIHVDIEKASSKEWKSAGLLFVGSLIFVGLVYYYKPFIDNHFSMQGVRLGMYHLDWANYMDILTTSLFLVGMYLMAKRAVESWYFWIAADIICIPMMLYKGLAITSLQYFVFTFMAIVGLIEWRKSLKSNFRNEDN
ncbi:nicotinamide riboside transporter PnuC [Soonwooa sp.]|uniref:nicotinamide riboside transporter PnuC n=1 Tax=Soonwooa sp. TaxID=1938592 RepID=UPI00260D5EC3|nr:nicotinamide riboside transporter PnuC [Soonwooa sp.]